MTPLAPTIQVGTTYRAVIAGIPASGYGRSCNDCDVDRERWPSGVCRQQDGGTQFNRRGYDQRIRQPQLGSVLGPQPRRGCSNLPSGWLNSSRKSCEKLIDLCNRARTLPEWPDEYFGVGGGRDSQLFAPTPSSRQGLPGRHMVGIARIENRDDDAGVEDRQRHSRRSSSR